MRWRQELVAANQASRPFACPGALGANCISSAELDSLVRTGGSQAFAARYPDAVIVVASQAILSPNRNHALIYFGWSCDGLCGMGQLVQLRRMPDGWVVEQAVRLWVS